MVAALAVVAARNEAPMLRVLLPQLVREGFEVVVIDHASRDETHEVAESLVGDGVLEVRTLPWTGCFDLRELLRAKAAIYESRPHEWLAHFDADEWPRAGREVTLCELLEEVGRRGFRAVNFDEFAFVPEAGTDALGSDFRRVIRHYYFFEPVPLRLQRIWHRSLGVSNEGAAGHRLPIAPEAIWPESQPLRHYLGLSQSAMHAKRANREYPRHALERGWHAKRLKVSSAPLDAGAVLRRCSPWDERALDRSEPCRRHFWSGVRPPPANADSGAGAEPCEGGRQEPRGR